jgi:signal transduction histidine kinase
MKEREATIELFASLILTDEVRKLVDHLGVRVSIECTNMANEALSDDARESLTRALLAAQQRGEHVQRLATVGGLAAGVTHEARNLLTGVLGLAQVLASTAAPGEQRDSLQLIVTEARRCTELLANYLKLSRSSAEAVRSLDAAEIVRPISAIVAYELRQRQCSLAVSVEDDLPRVLGSPSELQRVIINLVLNAADACGKGGHIYVRATSEDGQYLRIDVTDDGPGVPPELRESIFEPFFTTKTASEGTGLGLALSRRIAETHRGELVLAADTRPGTTFSLRLPATPREVRR